MKILPALVLLCIGSLIGVLATLLSGAVQYPLGNAAPERASPAEHISENNIHVYPDRVEIMLDNPKWAAFANTNSMDPVFDQGNYAIQITPQNPDEIAVGDIISYKYGDKTIIHRVIEKGIDGNGWYFIVKGDNNPAPDPDKVRFEQISRLTVAVIY
jgi:hypothetical protein